ncbi:probable mitochondrial inner membrane protein OXA1L [Coccomyxa sp. Obi]|nr:probable mitochondrial inner membrane protein OXA1L [Coccomyxa sp. Obi]
MQASKQPGPVAQLPEKLWPTTKAFVSLIDGVHSYTGLPWWTTLSLTAVGVRAALLPISVRQMRASAALWSTWRQAQQNAAARTAASQQTRSNFSGTAASQSGHSAAGGASSHMLTKSTATSGATGAAAPVVAWPRQQEETLRPAAAQAALRHMPPSAVREVPQVHGNTTPYNNPAAASGTPHSSKVTAGKQGPAAAGPGVANPGDLTGVDVVRGQPVAGVSDQRQESDGAAGEGGQATNSRGGRAGPGPASLAATLAEYSQLRGRSGAPHPAWIIGSPLIQATVFGTSVFAARAMAASNWPGFASGGALWFPDLTKAAVVIHWGQDAMSTAVSFPYGQLGAAMPIAVALALFANINMSFGRAGPAASDGKGEGAVAAYVMGIAKGLLEWVTVPVLALALGLPHGALVYWLSSSTFSILQNLALQRPEVRERLRLPSPRRRPGPLQDWGTSVTPGNSADQPDIDQLFVKAAEARAKGDVAAALALIQRVRSTNPAHAPAHFAAGQLHAELKQWPRAEAAYAAAAGLEADMAQRARAWLGAGVAQHAQGDLDAALQAFERAAQDALAAADMLSAPLPPTPNADLNHTAGIATGSDRNAIPDGNDMASATFGSDHVPMRSNRADGDAGAAAGAEVGAELGADDMADRERRAILARRTAVRALLAQAGSLKQLGRLPEALQAALRAAELDDSVRKIHVAPLEAEIAAARTRQ